ncbi:hypothetical protein AWW68_07740 [Roseivirga spongicola]|uniref:Uncharacterized protein n=1 Tax=Roseivirga spongicola TaxID=333140 RepID=A0A150XAH6_9BACT|nr:hypothetical protein AWW68_07740 [Roseivirga spongicola]PWL29276.1 MAG: hypothetical protein DCO95_12640 [Roseivirga sp. XM-24bin3]
MKSPITGLSMPLSSELRNTTFKKVRVQFEYLFYLCEKTGEKFVTTALDEINFENFKRIIHSHR